ncbi:MAG TPA: LCCL domain-containing protein [Pyrinomonadaceae bacterium]|jgi:cytoskeletal protein RodZ
MSTTDDNQAYCLMDGTPLVNEMASEPTVSMSRTQPTVAVAAPPHKKKNTGLWIMLVVLGIFVIGGLIGLLMYAAYRMGSETASVKVNTNSNTSPTPKPSGTPKSTPQTTPTTTPASQTTPESSSGDSPNSDEPTPITWNTGASTFKTETGLTYTFDCPPDGTAGAVWGSDVYTADSSVCTAAVHAGKITLENGGQVKIEITGGRSTYGATTRNGITSNPFGPYPHSFVFR